MASRMGWCDMASPWTRVNLILPSRKRTSSTCPGITTALLSSIEEPLTANLPPSSFSNSSFTPSVSKSDLSDEPVMVGPPLRWSRNLALTDEHLERHPLGAHRDPPACDDDDAVGDHRAIAPFVLGDALCGRWRRCRKFAGEAEHRLRDVRAVFEEALRIAGKRRKAQDARSQFAQLVCGVRGLHGNVSGVAGGAIDQPAFRKYAASSRAVKVKRSAWLTIPELFAAERFAILDRGVVLAQIAKAFG